jgi:hypothetical protein
MIAAISKSVEAVQEIYPYVSLTFLLSNGRELYGYRDCTVNAGYYTLYYTRTPSAFVISQEKFFDGSWDPIENGYLLVVSRDLSPEIRPLIPEVKPKAV